MFKIKNTQQAGSMQRWMTLQSKLKSLNVSRRPWARVFWVGFLKMLSPLPSWCCKTVMSMSIKRRKSLWRRKLSLFEEKDRKQELRKSRLSMREESRLRLCTRESKNNSKRSWRRPLSLFWILGGRNQYTGKDMEEMNLCSDLNTSLQLSCSSEETFKAWRAYKILMLLRKRTNRERRIILITRESKTKIKAWTNLLYLMRLLKSVTLMVTQLA